MLVWRREILKIFSLGKKIKENVRGDYKAKSRKTIA